MKNWIRKSREKRRQKYSYDEKEMERIMGKLNRIKQKKEGRLNFYERRYLSINTEKYANEILKLLDKKNS